MDPSSWLIATTRPLSEASATRNCLAQGFEVYRPLLLRRQRQQPGRPCKYIASSLFPNYLFIRYRDAWPRLLSTVAVTSVLRYGDKPSTIPDHLLQQLRKREVDGIIQLPKPQPGQRVHVVRGPFAGHSGLFQGMSGPERVRVLLEVLERRLRVFIAVDAIAIAA